MANEYFTLMNKARKEGAKSFTYNGKTYVATKTKTGMIVYKQKENKIKWKTKENWKIKHNI